MHTERHTLKHICIQREADDELIRTEQFRKGTAGSDVTSGLTLQSKSFFMGAITEEKTDFVQNYSTDGTTVRNTQLFFYKSGVRAVSAGADDELIRTEQFRKGTADSDATSALTLQSKSYFMGLITEEKTDYVQNYATDGTSVRNTQIFYYKGNNRAVTAGADDELIRTEQFRKGTADSDVTSGLTLQSKSHFKGAITEA